MSSFKQLVETVMQHGPGVIGETDQNIWSALNWMDRTELEEILMNTNIGIQVYPNESDDELKQAIVANIEDGTLDLRDVLGEDSPPGFKGTVKAMKKDDDVDNPYALAWWMKNKGYDSHKKASDANKNESIRVWHPTHGNGTVNRITESHINVTWDNLQSRITSPSDIPFNDAKYLNRLREEYSSDPSDVDYDTDKDDEKKKKHSKKKKMKKKDIKESMVAVGMMGIGNTDRNINANKEDSYHLTMDDLMYEDEEQNNNRNGSGKARSDYVNVPRPSDTILTNQENQSTYDPEPLATHAGYEDASDGMEPDGDYGDDLLPVDAPGTPKVRDLEASGKRHNTRTSGEGEDTHEAGQKDIDFEGDKPEEKEDNNMKKNESNTFNLTAKDLGIFEEEHYTECGDDRDGMDDMNETHDTGAGEVAFTPDFLHKIFMAISTQAPDEKTLQALCDGLKAASEETGATLDVSDWDNVKAKAGEAYGGGAPDVNAGPDADDEVNSPDAEMDPPEGEAEDTAYFEDPDGDYVDDDYDYEEDRAEGDGEKAGPEAGPEHEGKTKMFDKKGDGSGKKHDDPHRGKEQRMKQRRDQRKKKQSGRYTMEDGSGTPIGTGSNAGPGGGSTTDLSKPKKYAGKAVGTQTGSGPGGGSTSEFGQKPTQDGGSNLLPANDKGNQLGADDNPFSKGQPNPRKQKALAAEARQSKKAKNKQKLDEAIMLGMNSIPYMNDWRNPEIPDNAYDDDDELKMIKRRAGMENWWKD